MKFQYKSVLRMFDGLETALKQEQNKYALYPNLPDMVPDHVNAQGWCYVVAGYFLLEMAKLPVKRCNSMRVGETR